MKENIKRLELSSIDDKFIIIYNDKYYSVSKLFYSIVYELKNDIHQKNTFIKNNKINSHDYNEILKLVADKVDEMISKGKKSSKSYIILSVKILSEKTVIFLSKYLVFFFQKTFFKFFFPLIIFLNILFFFFVNNKYKGQSTFEISPFNTFVVYLTLLVIMMFHELGHSSASSFYKIKPKEIGFGFYIIFPVLYSNVTRIWKLHKNKRIVVNLGGIYFQGIINLIFFVLVLLNSEYNYFIFLVLLIIKTNLSVMAYSLFPFVRNDGYWIVSDYFNIPNLNKKSYSYIIELLLGKEKIKYSLLLYSTGQILFVFSLIYFYFPSIPRSFSRFYFTLNEKGFADLFAEDFSILLNLLMSIIIGIVMTISLSRFIKPLFKK